MFSWKGMSCVFPPSHLAPSMSQRGHQAAGPLTWPGPQLPCESERPGGLDPSPGSLPGEPKVELTCRILSGRPASQRSGGLSSAVVGAAAGKHSREQARAECLLLPSVLLPGQEVGPPVPLSSVCGDLLR